MAAAPRCSALRREPGCGTDGPGTRCGAPRGCHPKGFATVAVRVVAVGSKEDRGKESFLPPGERKDDLFVRRGRHRAFLWGESENASSAGSLFTPEGIKKKTAKKQQNKTTGKPPPNQPKNFCRERIEEPGPCGRPAGTHPRRLPPGEPARGPPRHGPAGSRARAYFCCCCFG